MPIETADLHQKAVLCSRVGRDRYGNPLLDDPVEIDTRWEKTHKESIDPNGQPVLISEQVVVDREIAIGSILWLGELSSFGTPYTNLREVVEYRETPDIKGVYYRRVVGLRNWSNHLPDYLSGTGS